MTTCTLRAWTQGDISLSDGVSACAGLLTADAVGLLYSLESADFVRLNGSALVDRTNAPRRDLDRVFEARIFSGVGELRWLKEPNATGRAAFVSEGEVGPTGWTPTPPTDVEPHNHQYLLWGAHAPANLTKVDGWTTLESPRTGRIAVPLTTNLAAGQRAILLAREYLGAEPGVAGRDHGNVAVVEERLIGLDLYRGN